ncbi:MAG: recombinase family protein [Eubacteriales bacterium]|nr:recombinase family protein [Eubacteriales bacterium]
MPTRLILPKTEKTGKKRVAAYCRVSSQHDEQMHSLEAQMSFYQDSLANDKDVEFVGIYADSGISGTRTRNRAEFLRLIEDCRAGKVDAIITKSVSRFGRNTVDTLVFTRELRNLGVDVYFEKEELHSCSSEGELLLTLMAAFAESESVSMSDNIKWGKRKRFENGTIESLALNNIYGFRKTSGDIVINETEAAVVRHIYDLFISGYGYTEIANRLIEENAPTRREGATWANTTVKNIIANEKLCGDCLFQKTYIQNPLSHRSRPNKGELPQFFVEDCLPAIVDKETWLVAQRMRERNHCKGSCLPSQEFPFKGMIYCGICRAPVNFYYFNAEGFVQKIVYRCSSRKKGAAKPVEGVTYTPPHKSTYTKNPSQGLVEYREKYQTQYVKPRPMICTDIRIPLDRPQKAFVQAWNYITGQRGRYEATLKRTVENTDDVLIRYRAKEMLELFDGIGRLHAFDYSLMRRTLDRVETTADEKLTLIFQSGIRITI